MMKFLADENYPKTSVDWLRSKNIDITSVSEDFSGVSDEEVLNIAINQHRTILTLDSDFGELIFKFKIKPKAGVIFFRLVEFKPIDLSLILMDLIHENSDFENCMVVINKDTIRIRKY